MKRRVSIERMARMWQYANHGGSGDGLTMADFIDLDFRATTFEGFLDLNSRNIQLYEEAKA